MRNSFLLLIAAMVLFSCNKGKIEQPTIPTTPLPDEPAPTVFLKDIQIPNLPSPFYHFEYNTDGKPIAASFASGFIIYDIRYNSDKISELDNSSVNRDRLQYFYDNDGNVNSIRNFDEANTLIGMYILAYDGKKLIKMSRYRNILSDMVLARTLTFSYLPDGNLSEIITHYNSVPAAGQSEMTTIDRFEQYDDKINVDGFSLIHPEFFEHWIILPGIRLQKNNPRKLTHIGDGANYKVDYTYTYNDKNAPLTKNGAGTWLTGTDAGDNFTTNSAFSYY